jgi:hypothetical protein
MQPQAGDQNSVASNALPNAINFVRANNQEDRILAALGLSHGPLPEVQTEWLLQYYEYLVAHLALPFEAVSSQDISGYKQLVSVITVVTLLHPDKHSDHEEFGLICQGLRGSQEIDFPLADVELPESAPNFQLIEDYWYWFWNWRFDPRI